MGKTRRNYPRGYFRYPRGRRKAIINGARPGAIPPDAWDDIPASHEAHMAFTVAERMKKKKGWKKEVIVHKICKKFKMTYRRAEDIVSWLF